MSCVQTGCTMPTSFQGVPFPAKPGKRLLRSVAFVFAWCGFTTKNTKDLSFVNSIAQLEGELEGKRQDLAALNCEWRGASLWNTTKLQYSTVHTVRPRGKSLSPRVLHEFRVHSRWKFPLFLGWKKFKIELEQLERRSDVWKENQKRTRDQGHREGPRARRGWSLLNYRQRPGGRGRTNPSLFLRRNHLALSLPNFNFSARRRRNL